MTPSRVLPFLALAWLLAAVPAPACNIPVFRYALERWRNDRDEDRYQVTVFHRGPLSDDARAAVEELRAAGEGPRALANVATDLVDVAGPLDDGVRKLWQVHADRPLPWMVVRFPDGRADRPPLWAGPLTRDATKALVDSPARREVVRRLLHGDAVVWVLLEGGDRDQDDAAARRLRAELDDLEKTLKLPDGVGEGEARLLSSLPLRLSFSVLRVARTDPAEERFVAMLHGGRKDATPTSGPVVFPVFGRGRVLDPIALAEADQAPVKEAATFLCGDCSCLVKRLNPGIDLLTSADWDSVVDGPAPPQPESTPAAGQPVLLPAGPRFTEPPAQVDEAAPHSLRPALVRSLLLAAVAGAALLVVVTGLLLLRSRSRRSAPEGNQP